MPTVFELLQHVPILSGITDKELSKIAKKAVRKNYKKDTYLFMENAKGDELYLIISGLIKIHKSDNTGKIKTLTYVKAGDFIGEMALLDDEVRSASAQAVEDTEVLTLSHRNFRDFIIDNPAIALKIMKTLSVRLRETNKEIEDLTFRNLPGRVASCLLKLAEKYGKPAKAGRRIDMKFTHQELADIIGTAREVVTSTLSAFKKAGAIEMNQHYIILTDENELKTWIV